MIRTKISIIAGIRRGSLAMWRDQDGMSAIVFAIFLPALVAFAALAIDMSYAYWTRTQLQHAASSAAMAGASQLNDPTDASAAAKAEAIVYANNNLATALHGTTLVAADVILGNWDAPTRTFTPMGTTGGAGAACDNPVPSETNPNCLIIDAVQATTRKAVANGNPLNLFLSHVIGLAQTDINTSAIAWSQGGGAAPEAESNCFQNGILAGNITHIQSTNTFGDDFCVYGHCGILISQDNSFAEGTQVAVGPDPADASCSGDGYNLPPEVDTTADENCDPITGLDCIEDAYVSDPPNVASPGYMPEIALEWTSVPAGIFDTLEFTDDPVLPSLTYALDAVTLASVDNMDPVAWDADRWKDAPPCTSTGQITEYFVVNAPADITGPMNMCDVAIIADDINLGEGHLDNVLLVTRAWGGNCSWSGNGIADVSSECYNDANINFTGGLVGGVKSSLINVTVAARGNINFGSDMKLGGTACEASTTAIEIFAMGDIIFQSSIEITNATIVAGHDLTLQSDAIIDLSGTDTTMQALNNVTMQSNGTLGACPDEEGEGGEGGEEGEGAVVGENLRLVD